MLIGIFFMLFILAVKPITGSDIDCHCGYIDIRQQLSMQSVTGLRRWTCDKSSTGKYKLKSEECYVILRYTDDCSKFDPSQNDYGCSIKKNESSFMLEFNNHVTEAEKLQLKKFTHTNSYIDFSSWSGILFVARLKISDVKRFAVTESIKSFTNNFNLTDSDGKVLAATKAQLEALESLDQYMSKLQQSRILMPPRSLQEDSSYHPALKVDASNLPTTEAPQCHTNAPSPTSSSSDGGDGRSADCGTAAGRQQSPGAESSKDVENETGSTGYLIWAASTTVVTIIFLLVDIVLASIWYRNRRHEKSADLMRQDLPFMFDASNLETMTPTPTDQIINTPKPKKSKQVKAKVPKKKKKPTYPRPRPNYQVANSNDVLQDQTRETLRRNEQVVAEVAERARRIKENMARMEQNTAGSSLSVNRTQTDAD